MENNQIDIDINLTFSSLSQLRALSNIFCENLTSLIWSASPWKAKNGKDNDFKFCRISPTALYQAFVHLNLDNVYTKLKYK